LCRQPKFFMEIAVAAVSTKVGSTGWTFGLLSSRVVAGMLPAVQERFRITGLRH